MEKEKEPITGTKKAKSAQTENINYLKRLTSEKAKVSDLQEANYKILFKDFYLTHSGNSNLERVQDAVEAAADRLLAGSHYRVEYGSGVGNNCFFYALAALGFNRLGGVEEMRGTMNLLCLPAEEEAGERREIKEVKEKEDAEKVEEEVDEIYHPEGMITEADIQLFAQTVGITVYLYTIAGGILQPAGAFEYGNDVFSIVHQGNHYMPMHPVQ